MPSRREFLLQTTQLGTLLTLPFRTTKLWADEQVGTEVNDVQSQLNATRVHRVVEPTSLDSIQAALQQAQKGGSCGKHRWRAPCHGRPTVRP